MTTLFSLIPVSKHDPKSSLHRFIVPVSPCSYEKCDPNDPNNWWNLPPSDAVPYASAAPESADASNTVMMGSADGMPMSKVKEDSFGTNNQVRMIDHDCLPYMVVSLTSASQ